MSTAEQQRRWRAKHASGKPAGRPVTAPCGTVSAYKRHIRRREPVDDACRLAYNEWQRDRYRARRLD